MRPASNLARGQQPCSGQHLACGRTAASHAASQQPRITAHRARCNLAADPLPPAACPPCAPPLRLPPLHLQACEAADYLIKLPDRIRKLTERAAARKAKASKGATSKFSWVFDREVALV